MTVRMTIVRLGWMAEMSTQIAKGTDTTKRSRSARLQVDLKSSGKGGIQDLT